MRIVFMGTGEIALPSLDWLLESPEVDLVGVYTQPDKKVGRRQELTPPEVKVRAEAHRVPVFQPESFRREPEAIEQLKSLNCDIAVVMAYGQILPRAVIAAPGIACVNLHASLLPRHRGASPIQAAIRDGDEESGITLMYIVPRLDAGDMILKSRTPISDRDTGGTLHDRLAGLGPGLLQQGLPRLFEGRAEAEPQDESRVTYSGKLGREDGEIDWTRPAEQIERLIRAYDPWPGTSTLVRIGNKDRKLKIFPYAECGSRDGDEDPGTILDTRDGLCVACGEGTSLRLKGDLQVEGKKRLPVGEFLKGTGLEEGETIFGSVGEP